MTVLILIMTNGGKGYGKLPNTMYIRFTCKQPLWLENYFGPLHVQIHVQYM